MALIGILVSLVFLVWTAYKGWNPVVGAAISALIAAVFSIGFRDLIPAVSEIYLAKAAGFVKSYFLVFMVGSIFGKLMEATGLAKDIGVWIVRKVGPSGAIFAILLAGVVLTYGGILCFICAFTLYPLAAAIFRTADIPKRLIPGAICGGCMTVAMTCLPGTPQVQNLIPTQYLGTTLFAAPVLGIISSIFIFGCVWAWMEFRAKRCLAAGEGYGTGHLNEPTEDILSDKDIKPIYLSIIPLLSIVVLNYFLTKWIKSWPVEWVESYGLTGTSSKASIWALSMATIVGCFLTLIIGWKKIGSKSKMMTVVNNGAVSSLSSLMFVGSVMGYGGIVASLPIYTDIANGLMSISLGDTPLLSEWLTVNILSGITGSATGGLTLSMQMMGDQYLAWAQNVGISADIVHRIASMSSGGLDTLPHCGGVITVLTVAGLTHKQSYKDICATSVIIPFVATFLIIVVMTLFHLY